MSELPSMTATVLDMEDPPESRCSRRISVARNRPGPRLLQRLCASRGCHGCCACRGPRGRRGCCACCVLRGYRGCCARRRPRMLRGLHVPLRPRRCRAPRGRAAAAPAPPRKQADSTGLPDSRLEHPDPDPPSRRGWLAHAIFAHAPKRPASPVARRRL